jgi:hypothetical protein
LRVLEDSTVSSRPSVGARGSAGALGIWMGGDDFGEATPLLSTLGVFTRPPLNMFDPMLPLIVGVRRPLDSAPDIADPGLGLGLGLYIISDSTLESLSYVIPRGPLSREAGTLPESMEADISENDPAPAESEDVAVTVGSMRYDTPPLSPLKTITERSKRSSFSVDVREPLAEVRILGFRPLSRTFLRALIPTQLTSCFIASLSDTARFWAVRRIVPVLGNVWKDVIVFDRMGVMKEYGCGVFCEEAIFADSGVRAYLATRGVESD